MGITCCTLRRHAAEQSRASDLERQVAVAATGGDGAAAARQRRRRSDPVPGCVFCGIAAGSDEEARIVHRDSRFVVFHDRAPAATAHLQVVTVQHIDNVNSLEPCAADNALVSDMLALGREVLSRLHPGAPQRFGFHRAPFCSVYHLHMHALALPFLPGAMTFKYPSPAKAHWSPWWLSAEDALAALQPSPTAKGGDGGFGKGL